MDETIEIMGLTRYHDAKPNAGGATVLASFDVVVRGIALRGCALTRTKRQGLVAWPPHMQDELGRFSVRFRDDSLRHAIMTAARDAYRALGGTDAEWVPSQDRPGA